MGKVIGWLAGGLVVDVRLVAGVVGWHVGNLEQVLGQWLGALLVYCAGRLEGENGGPDDWLGSSWLVTLPMGWWVDWLVNQTRGYRVGQSSSC